MRRRLADPVEREIVQHVALVLAVYRALPHRCRDRARAVAQLDRQHRVPVHFLERLLAPLTAAIDGEREAFPLKRFDQEVGHRLLRVAAQEIGVRGGEDHRRVRMLAVNLAREPETVASRHHHVDDREIVLLPSERLQRLDGARRGVRLEADCSHPSRHQVAHRFRQYWFPRRFTT